MFELTTPSHVGSFEREFHAGDDGKYRKAKRLIL
jgi:hypothetical protein